MFQIFDGNHLHSSKISQKVDVIKFHKPNLQFLDIFNLILKILPVKITKPTFNSKGRIILCSTAGKLQKWFCRTVGNAVQVSTHSYICSGQSVLSERHVFLYNLANFRRNKTEIIFSLKKITIVRKFCIVNFCFLKTFFYCEKH